jgi:tetratricopeptide (TPR) repeat protein
MKKVLFAVVTFAIASFVLQSCAPTNPHLTEAKISMNRDDLQKAQKELDIVLQTDPENLEAAYLRGYINFKQEVWNKMSDNFDKVKSIDPLYEKDNIANMSLKAFGVLRGTGINDKFNTAVQIISADPEKAEKLFQSALVDLELADKLISDDFITKYIIGTIHLQLGDKEKAESLFLSAVSIADPAQDGKNLVSAYINLSNIYTERKDHDKAVEMLNKVLEFDPSNHDALLQMAKHFEDSEEYDKALPMYEKMLESDPENVDILFNQGIMYKKIEKIDEAINNFQKIVSLRPEDGEAVYFLSEFYSQKADFAKVIELLEPRFDGMSEEWQDKVRDNIQIALVKSGRAKDAQKYMKK